MTRNRRTLSILGQTLLASAMGSAVAFAQAPIVLPLSYPALQQFKNNPEVWTQPAPSVPAAGPAVAGPWQTTNNAYPGAATPGNPLLMTDGTVIVHQISNDTSLGRNWYRLTPDINGSYVNGTRSSAGLLPAGYGPLFHASEVLPDGRVVVNGGEYNFLSPTDTTLGAIYYPSLGAWTNVAPPANWTKIGDAPSVVLNNGTYLLANCCAFNPALAATFNATPPFTMANWTITGTNKANGAYNEEGLTVLPNGNVLTVDVQLDAQGGSSEIYSPGTGNWSSGGATGATLTTCAPSNSLSACELGPAVLRLDFPTNGSGDNLLVFGGNNEGTAPTVIYNTNSGTWSAGPNVPSVGSVPYTLADAPAAVLPSGNVLFAASPSNWPASNSFPTPTNFWEVGPNSGGNVLTAITQNPDGPSTNSFIWNFLVLPNGQVLAVEPQASRNVWLDTPLAGAPNASWLPVISTSPTDVTRAFTYTLNGTQFNGLSHGAAYGDDVQANTNFPIAQIVNTASGHVFYERTSGFNTMSVARGQSSSTNFTVSGATETGPSTLFVIANGISSAGVPVTVH